MIYLQCTQALLKELAGETTTPAPSHWLDTWHAHLMTIERKKCILVTNDETLYSFVIVGWKSSYRKNFKTLFTQALFKSLLNASFPQADIETVMERCQNIRLCKTRNRTVLGSMNELQKMIEFTVHDSGGWKQTDIQALQDALNLIILGAINYRYAIALFTQRLREEPLKSA